MACRKPQTPVDYPGGHLNLSQTQTLSTPFRMWAVPKLGGGGARWEQFGDMEWHWCGTPTDLQVTVVLQAAQGSGSYSPLEEGERGQSYSRAPYTSRPQGPSVQSLLLLVPATQELSQRSKSQSKRLFSAMVNCWVSQMEPKSKLWAN